MQHMVTAEDLLTDPVGSNALVQAAYWVRLLLLGSIATVIATLAIAAIGFGVLQGRIQIRRGIVVVVGCFVISGAASIANGLIGLSFTGSDPPSRQTADVENPPPILAPPQPQIRDPYAGASVPVQ